MVNSVKGPLDYVQDIYSEMPGDGVSHKAKNRRTAVFIVAVLTLLKEIVQKLINNEAVRAEMLKKLEAAIEEVQAADSSKTFWEKLRQGVLAEVERQLKALASQNKVADNLHAKVAVLGQHLDHLFKQVDAVSALAARFEEAHPAITASITAIDTNLSVIEKALEEDIAAPEELVTLSEQVADIRKHYLGIQEKYRNWCNEINKVTHELNAAASAVETTMTQIAASVGTPDPIASAAIAPSVAPRPAAPVSVPASISSLDPIAPASVAIAPSVAPHPAAPVSVPTSTLSVDPIASASVAIAPSVAPRPAAPVSVPTSTSFDPVAPLAVAPPIAIPVPAVAPAVVMPAPEISQRAIPRVVSRPVVTATPAPKPSFIVDDSTRDLLVSLGVSPSFFESSQQKLELFQSQLGALGLRIGAAEKTIVSQARQHPGIEIGNNPEGFGSSQFIFLKDTSLAARKPRPSSGAREEEEERLAALFRQHTGFGITRR